MPTNSVLPGGDDATAEPRNYRIKSSLIREMLSEFIGIVILLIIGNGSVAQNVLHRGIPGGFMAINFAYGLGVTMAVYYAGQTSGAHLNPAVTISLAAYKKFPWKKVPYYLAAQFVGGFVSGFIVWATYYNALNNFDGGVRKVVGVNGTAGIFATYPAEGLSVYSGVIDQIVGTAILVGTIFAITDGNNNKMSDGLAPVVIGLLVLAIGLSFGFNYGYAINPARDFGPRLFTAIQWGRGVFTEPNGQHWWIVPFSVPYIGGIVGASIYQWTIGRHLSTDKEEHVELESVKVVQNTHVE